MPKPDISLARWAVTTGGTPAANISAPTGGQRDSGWNLNQVAVSSIFNALSLEAFKWFQYIDAGALEGDHSIDGGLVVDGSLTVNGSVLVDGALESLEVEGSIQTGGHYRRPARARKVPASAGHATGGTFNTANAAFEGGGSDVLLVPLEVQEGEQLLEVHGRVQTSAIAAITMDVIRVNGSTTTATTLGSATSGASGQQTLTVTGLTEPIDADNDALFARFTFDAASQTVRTVRYVTDVP